MLLFELLKACADGFIEVKCLVPVSGATSNIGKVVLLKDNGKFKGCAVQFPGLTYDTWFSQDLGGKDKRSHYMHELSFIEK